VDLDVRKPANRPSRRHHLVDAAVELFSLEPWEVITVADIVERAGMTPATFYYHFSSREELLEEIVRDFAQKWLGMVERLLDSAETPDELCAVAMALLDEIDATGQEAKIFFLSTAKEPLMAERIRSDARRQLIRSARRPKQSVASLPTVTRPLRMSTGWRWLSCTKWPLAPASASPSRTACWARAGSAPSSPS